MAKRGSYGRICCRETGREREGKERREEGGIEKEKRRQREDSCRLVIRASMVRRRNYGGT